MPSRSDARRWAESAWRGIALLFLASATGLALRPGEGVVERVSGAALAASLPRLTRGAAGQQVEVTFDAAPGARERAWLAALGRAGDTVSWLAARRIPPLAVEVIARADPAGGVRVLAAGAAGDTLLLADAAGALDTAVMAASIEGRRLPAFVAPLAARVGAQVARGTPRDSLARRRVVVLATAGWEGKFVLAALEERGWLAGARFAVAPGIVVSQDTPPRYDTASIAAVVVLDSAAAGDGRALAAFARAGGGLVLGGDAARSPALAMLAPGVPGARVAAAALSFADSAPRRALGFRAIVALPRDAIVLEARGGQVAVAARRVGRARVALVGYEDTWRWRLGGGAHAVEAHRAWWSEIVSGVAYRAALPIAGAAEGNADAAPLAELTAALGAPVATAAPFSVYGSGTGLDWWIFGLIVAGLLAEWGSRRLRGAK